MGIENKKEPEMRIPELRQIATAHGYNIDLISYNEYRITRKSDGAFATFYRRGYKSEQRMLAFIEQGEIDIDSDFLTRSVDYGCEIFDAMRDIHPRSINFRLAWEIMVRYQRAIGMQTIHNGDCKEGFSTTCEQEHEFYAKYDRQTLFNCMMDAFSANGFTPVIEDLEDREELQTRYLKHQIAQAVQLEERAPSPRRRM